MCSGIQGVALYPRFQIELEFGFGFCGGRKIGDPGEKLLEAGARFSKVPKSSLARKATTKT